MAKGQDKEAVKDFSDLQEGWEEQETFSEFPPYWNPAEGKSFQGKVLARDETGDFPRYVIEATAVTECAKGSGDDAEPVMVNPGERFTVSEYSSLPLHLCFGLEVKATSTEKSKKKTKNGYYPWQWKFALPIADKKVFNERKAEASKLFTAPQDVPKELS